jgi:hypothetical protein
VALGAALALGAAPVRSAGTLSWTESPESLAAGRADGMAVSRSGKLFLAPTLHRLDGAGLSRSMHVWALVLDAAGRPLLGTGPAGRVLAIDARGAHEILALDEPMVTALAVLDDGGLLAATAPGGRIYRIPTKGKPELWAETGDPYVWALVVDRRGRVFAGTGERGVIYEIDASGIARPLFDSDEPHIVSLAVLEDGSLLAGGSGQGLVYRVDSEGHGLVLHDDDLPEAAALAGAPDGSVLVALVAPAPAEARRPALSLRLPDGTQVGSAGEIAGALEEEAGPTLHGFIEGLALPAAPPSALPRGRVVRIDPAGRSVELWRSTSEAPFCLGVDGKGRHLFGTGEPARLYRIEAGDEVALLATLQEAQVTALRAAGSSVVVATSNPAAVYRVEDSTTGIGQFVSNPYDAGGPARWGSIRWRHDQPQGLTEVFTRTGNSQGPDETWSAWGPALLDAALSPVPNPEGRYFQWKVRRSGDTESAARISDVTVFYEPFNHAPELLGFRLEGGTDAFAGPLTLRWSVRDADGDPLELTVEYRALGAGSWSVAAVSAAGPSAHDDPESWREGRTVWETESLPEGRYEVRAVASDQAGNPAGEGLVAAGGPLWPIVDRTPPRIAIHPAAAATFDVVLEDEHSWIRRLEILERGAARFTARSADGVCDSPRESFRVELPAGQSAGDWTARGVDAAGNVVEQSMAGGALPDPE